MRHLLLLISVALLACACTATSPTTESAAEAARFSRSQFQFVPYPAEGAVLGQGWNSFASTPTAAICIEFEPSVVPGHDIQMDFRHIASRYQLNRAMSLSLSASYSGFGANIGAKGSYSNSLEINSDKTHMLANIQVWKDDIFVAPQNLIRNGEAYKSIPVRLTKEARKALDSGGQEAFGARCGDSFVQQIRRGASLSSFLTFDALSKSTREKLEASMNGSGWGFTADAAASLDTIIKNSSQALEIRTFQTGGPLKATKLTPEDWSSTVSQFLDEANPATFVTKPYSVYLKRYDSLPDFQGKAQSSSTDAEDLIALYWLFDDLRKQYSAALQDLSGYLVYSLPMEGVVGDRLDFYAGPTPCTAFVSQAPSTQTPIEYDESGLSDECKFALGQRYDHPWTISQIVYNLEEITAIQRVLAEVLRSCKPAESFGKCRPQELMDLAKARIVEGQKEFKRHADNKGASNSGKTAHRYDFVIELLNTIELGGATASDGSLSAKWEALRSAAIWSSGGAPRGFSSLLRFFDPKLNVPSSATLKELHESYVYFTLVAPFRRPLARDPCYLDAAGNAGTVDANDFANAPAIRKCIRQERVVNLLKTVEDFCDGNLNSRLCLDVSRLRELASAFLPGPIHSTGAPRTEYYEERECRRPPLAFGLRHPDKCGNKMRSRVVQSATIILVSDDEL